MSGFRWQHFPFAPKRFPFFYGWVVLAAATLGILASIPGQTMGVGVFRRDLETAMRLGDIQLSWAYAFGTIISSLLLPFAGTLLDRFGARAMVIVSGLGLGASLLLLRSSGFLTGPETAGFPLRAMVAGTLCFLAVRFSGQGCLTVASRVAIGKWFNHRRGLATAISSVFVVFGFNAAPRLLNDMVGNYGWRDTYLILAFFVAAGMAFVGVVFFRDNPESCGLEMDGVRDEAWHRRMAKRVPDIHREFTRGEALRTWGFWVFALGTSTQSLIMTAMTFYIDLIGKNLHLDRDVSYAVFLPMSYYSVITNIVGGWLSDRIHLKWLLVVMMAAQVLGTIMLTEIDHATGRHLMIAGFGISTGFFNLLTTVTWPRFFGRAHLGAISGVHMSLMVFASAIGPVLFATMNDWTGNFQLVALGCAALPVAILFGSFVVRNPQDAWAGKASTGSSREVE